MTNLPLWLSGDRLALPVGVGNDTFVDTRDVAQALLMLFDGIRARNIYPPTQSVAELLGRPATTLDDWLAESSKRMEISKWVM